MKTYHLYILLGSLLLSLNTAVASTISNGGTAGSGSTTPTVTDNDFNILVDGNLFIDISVFSDNQIINLNSNTSIIADNLSIFSYDSLPTQPDLSVIVFNALNLSLNTSGDVLLFSDLPISSGIFEATNIYIGNYSSLKPVPLPPSLILFLSGIVALLGKNALTRR